MAIPKAGKSHLRYRKDNYHKGGCFIVLAVFYRNFDPFVQLCAFVPLWFSLFKHKKIFSCIFR